MTNKSRIQKQKNPLWSQIQFQTNWDTSDLMKVNGKATTINCETSNTKSKSTVFNLLKSSTRQENHIELMKTKCYMQTCRSLMIQV
jgi:hypothetical protein